MKHSHKDIVKKWNKGYAKFKLANPDKTFGEYSAMRVSKTLMTGGKSVVLGSNLVDKAGNPIKFEDAGRRYFNDYLAITKLRPDERIIDYGCGSLRVGYHIMNFVNPGNYFGLDPTTDYIDMGKTLIGSSLQERRPHLGAINRENIAKATEFAADIVLSVAVASHVHPDDLAAYFENLQSLTWKPGARLIFNATISKNPEHYRLRSWSLPLDFHLKALPELRLEDVRAAPRAAENADRETIHRIFSFVRAG